MPFQKGQSGNPLGQIRAKPFRDALRIEIAAAGADQKALREIARNLIEVARKPDPSALPAIKEIADRLDGKVPQAVIGDADEDPINLLHKIERVIVNPANQDG